MSVDGEEALRRHLLPGESLVQRYEKVVSARKFRAVLTDHRLLLVGRGAVEEIHLNSISSMGESNRSRKGIIALGVALLALGILLYQNELKEWLAIASGIPLIVLGFIWKKYLVKIYASGRTFDFQGETRSLSGFIRDVRLQQSRFGGYARGSEVATSAVAYETAPAALSAANRYTPQREVIREIVKVRCGNCGKLVDITMSNCPSCAAPL